MDNNDSGRQAITKQSWIDERDDLITRRVSRLKQELLQILQIHHAFDSMQATVFDWYCTASACLRPMMFVWKLTYILVVPMFDDLQLQYLV